MGNSRRHDGTRQEILAARLSLRLPRRAMAWAALLLALAGFSGVATAESSVEVITAADRVGTTVDRKLLLSAYIGRLSSWPDGKPITLYVLPDNHPLHVQFCRQLLGTYPYVLRNAWDKLVYTGTGFAPLTVSSEEEMRKRVRDTPGAIGYASATTDRAPPTEQGGSGRDAGTRGVLQ